MSAPVITGIVFAGLTALGAVSALIVPLVANRRDDRRRALDLKDQISSDMTTQVVDLIRFVQFTSVGGDEHREGADALNFRIAEWEQRISAVWTKLSVHFSEGLAADWRTYTDALRSLYELTWVGTKLDGVNDQNEFSAERMRLIDRFQYGLQRLGVDVSSVSWGDLADVANTNAYMKRWVEIRAMAEAPLPILLSNMMKARTEAPKGSSWRP